MVVKGSTPSPTTGPTGNNEIVARVVSNTGGALNIPRSELDAALYDAYGLQFLFNVVELDLAKTTLARQGMTLEQADIDRERRLTLKKLCGDQPESDWEHLLDQTLERQHLTRTEFEIRAIKIGACLRKIVEPLIANSLPEEAVHRGFGQIYGEKRQIADIQVGSLTDSFKVRQQLQAGVPFGKVAQQMSTDNLTAPLGGEWQPFSSQSPENIVPKAIKESAFAMEKIGEINSGTLQAGSNYHIIQLRNIIQPKAARYEDVKGDVRKLLEAQLVELKVKALREELDQLAQQQIEVFEPNLKGQWDKILDARRPKSVDRGKVLRDIDKEHQGKESQPGPAK